MCLSWSLTIYAIRTITIIFGLFVTTANAVSGVIGDDERRSLADYAKQHGKLAENTRREFKSSGRIMCPFNAASAFLVHRNNIILTARHVIFPEKSMKAYAPVRSFGNCAFEISDGNTSTWYDVDTSTATYPENAQKSTTDRFDWMAFRLKKPIEGVTPYQLPTSPISMGDKVTMVTIRQDGFPYDDWNERVFADCRVRKVETIDGKAESGLRTDCSATTGASGGALIRDVSGRLEVLGVQSSTSRNCPKYKDRTCSSFAVGLNEQLKAAILKLAAD